VVGTDVGGLVAGFSRIHAASVSAERARTAVSVNGPEDVLAAGALRLAQVASVLLNPAEARWAWYCACSCRGAGVGIGCAATCQRRHDVAVGQQW
jgi:hypothetical protein